MPERIATKITVIAHDYAVKTGSLNQNGLLDVTDYHSLDYRIDCQTLVGHSRAALAAHRDDAHVSLSERSRFHLNHHAHLYPNCFRALVARAW